MVFEHRLSGTADRVWLGGHQPAAARNFVNSARAAPLNPIVESYHDGVVAGTPATSHKCW